MELLTGEALERALASGRWSQDLVAAAMDAEKRAKFQRQPRPGAAAPPKDQENQRHAVLVSYQDGTRGTVVCIGNTSDRWNFACRLAGSRQPLATALYNGPWGNLGLFTALSHAIAQFFRTGQSPYPVERTLLVSGMLDAAMHSQQAGGRPIDTPHLEFDYAPRDFATVRENGATWRRITSDTPQPLTFEPYAF